MKSFLLCCFVLMTFTWVQANDQVLMPYEIPHVTSDMMTYGFWVERMVDADKIILDSKAIQQFNAWLTNTKGLTRDIFAILDVVQTENLADQLREEWKALRDQGYFLGAKRVGDELLDDWVTQMNLPDLVLGAMPKYALVVKRSDVRRVPSMIPLYEKPNDVHFDQIQESALDLGEAVVIVHQSLDKSWAYVLSSQSKGWVKMENLALGDKNIVQSYVNDSSFVVVTNPFVDIFWDQTETKWAGSARMGVRLPFIKKTDQMRVVRLPMRTVEGQLEIKEAYVQEGLIHEGYLPYTRRNIVKQALAWLNTPYGWGDMGGYPDCSRLIASVYASTGMILPRNSSEQKEAGEQILDFDDKKTVVEKRALLKDIKPGMLLYLKGHIMLALGEVDGRLYAIHATSGFTVKEAAGERKVGLMRVVVSDLDLGQESVKGSLLKRLKKVIAPHVVS